MRGRQPDSRWLQTLKKQQLRFTDRSAVADLQTLYPGDFVHPAFLEHAEPGRRQPPVFDHRRKCRFAEVPAIGWIGKNERKGSSRTGSCQPTRVSARDAGAVVQAEAFNIAPNQCRRTCILVDKQRAGCAARQGLDAERPGTCKKIENLSARYRIAESMDENVKKSLAQAVRRRADRRRRRRREPSPAQVTADDAHASCRVSDRPPQVLLAADAVAS